MKATCSHCEIKYDSEKTNNKKYPYLCSDCVKKAIKLDKRLKTMEKKEIIQEITDKFNNMENFKDLKEVLFYQEFSYEAPYFEIKSKRSSNTAYAFDRVNNSSSRVNYLYTAVNTGECDVNKLNRYLKLVFY